MTEKQFNRTRFSRVMTWPTYQRLDAMVEAMPTSLPEGARLRTKDRFTATKPTGLLTQVCLFWMRQHGAYVYRQNNQGSVRKDRNGEFKFTPGSKFAKGQPDIQGIFQGKPVYLEIKAHATLDRIRPDQVKFKESVESAGAEYWIVTMLGDLLEYMDRTCSTGISARPPPEQG